MKRDCARKCARPALLTQEVTTGHDTPKKGGRTHDSSGTGRESTMRRRPGTDQGQRSTTLGQEQWHSGQENEETEEEFNERVVRETHRDEKWETQYGDKRDPASKVEDHIVRILTMNISSFPRMGSLKQDRLKQEAKNNQIIGFSKINTNWTKVSAQDLLRNRTDWWYENPKTQVAWLCDPGWPSKHQKGGVSITIQGHLSPFAQEKGGDEAGLGR